ncbi:MAG: hypothetical protein WA144_11195 [Candidatus Methanoperedens sp.]
MRQELLISRITYIIYSITESMKIKKKRVPLSAALASGIVS